MAYWYDGAALAATSSPVIALFWCLIKFTTTTTTIADDDGFVKTNMNGRDSDKQSRGRTSQNDIER